MREGARCGRCKVGQVVVTASLKPRRYLCARGFGCRSHLPQDNTSSIWLEKRDPIFKKEVIRAKEEARRVEKIHVKLRKRLKLGSTERRLQPSTVSWGLEFLRLCLGGRSLRLAPSGVKRIAKRCFLCGEEYVHWCHGAYDQHICLRHQGRKLFLRQFEGVADDKASEWQEHDGSIRNNWDLGPEARLEDADIRRRAFLDFKIKNGEGESIPELTTVDGTFEPRYDNKHRQVYLRTGYSYEW